MARDSPRFPRAPFGTALGAADAQRHSLELKLGLGCCRAFLHFIEVELDAVRHDPAAFAQQQPDTAYALGAVLLGLSQRLVEQRAGDGKLVHDKKSDPVI
jgi:hypothetical protein